MFKTIILSFVLTTTCLAYSPGMTAEEEVKAVENQPFNVAKRCTVKVLSIDLNASGDSVTVHWLFTNSVTLGQFFLRLTFLGTNHEVLATEYQDSDLPISGDDTIAAGPTRDDRTIKANSRLPGQFTYKIPAELKGKIKSITVMVAVAVTPSSEDD